MRDSFTSVLGTFFAAITAIGFGITTAGAADDASGVRPFLKKHCYDCHSGDEPEGDFALDKLGTDYTDDATAEAWEKVLNQVVLGQMPPKDEPRPKPLSVDAFAKALDRQFVEAGRDSPLHAIVTHPKYGNYVDHELLFSGKIKGPAYSPSRVWRRSAYNANVGAFGLPVRIGIRDYAAEGQIDEPTLNSLIASISGVLTHDFDGRLQTRGRSKGKRTGMKKAYTNYFESEKPTKEQAKAALTYGFQQAMQRSPQLGELDPYFAFLEKNVAKGGLQAGLKTTLMAMYLTPEAIFRMELGLGEELPDGRRMLSPDEIYLAISLALGDSPITATKNDTDDHIARMYASGNLKTRDDVRRAVRYLLSSKHIEKPRIYRFFHEFFSFQETATIFKDGKTSYQQRGYMMGDGKAFITQILAKDEKVFEQLLTNPRYPLTVVRLKKTYTWPMLGFSYGLSKGDQALLQNVMVKAKTSGPKDNRGRHEFVRGEDGRASATNGKAHWDFSGERAGMLCHPTWLFAWSTNIENHPVQRGKWILEHLLAGTMPEVPVTVQAQVPEDPHRTLRERYVETRDKAYCWNCHKKMNPLGMPFETYDFMGKYRTKEVGKPVDASANFEGTGIPVLDKKKVKVKSAIELMDVLAKEPRVRQSIIRHAFRYFMGRNETLSDSPTLIAADKAYIDSGGSFNAVILSLLTSDSFVYRK